MHTSLYRGRPPIQMGNPEGTRTVRDSVETVREALSPQVMRQSALTGDGNREKAAEMTASRHRRCNNRKYARRTSSPDAAARWQRNANPAAYAEGMSRFLGRSVAGDRVSAYQQGISAATYRGGDADKWERNLISKMAG